MTTSINSLNSTTSELQVNGNPVMRFGADTSGQPFSFRNLLINGDCRIAQRGNTAVVANTWMYGGCDRIAMFVGGTTASGTIQQYPGQVTQSTFAQGAVVTTTGAGSVYFQERLEALNTKHLNGKYVTMTAWVYQDSGVAQNAFAQLAKPTTTADTFSAQTTLATGSTVPVPNGVLTKISLTYLLGASEASLGLAAQVAFTNIGAVTAKNFYIGDWQLEAGSIATPFENRPIGTELALCQRYYEKSYDQSVAPGTSTYAGMVIHSGVGEASGLVNVTIKFSVVKRAIPTMAYYNPNTGAAVQWQYASSTIANAAIAATAANTGMQGAAPYFGTVNSWQPAMVFGHWTASAEL